MNCVIGRRARVGAGDQLHKVAALAEWLFT